MDIIGIKPTSGDHESNFKKVGAIPCGCNTNGTHNYVNFHAIYYFTIKLFFGKPTYPISPKWEKKILRHKELIGIWFHPLSLSLSLSLYVSFFLSPSLSIFSSNSFAFIIFVTNQKSGMFLFPQETTFYNRLIWKDHRVKS